MFKNSSDTKPKTFGISFEKTSVQSVKDIVNSYKNHPSIIKIKQLVDGSDVSDSETFPFKRVNETDIKKSSEKSRYKNTSVMLSCHVFISE